MFQYIYSLFRSKPNSISNLISNKFSENEFSKTLIKDPTPTEKATKKEKNQNYIMEPQIGVIVLGMAQTLKPNNQVEDHSLQWNKYAEGRYKQNKNAFNRANTITININRK